MAIFLVFSTSGITFGKKVCRELKIAAILKILKYQTQLQLDLRYEKIVPNYAKKKYFHDDDVIDDVTGWPQSRPSIFLYKWNNNIFHDNLTTSKHIIIKLPVHMNHQIMTTIIWIHIHDIIHDVTKSQNRSNFEIDISPSIFELQRRSKAQNVGNAHGYLSGIFSFRYKYR